MREVGEAAAGTAIDTYGISEMLWSTHVYGTPKCIYVTPKGGTAVSADPIQMLRGAPNPKAAKAFIAFLLSREGQLLHCLKAGTPGGPGKNGINRPPIRRDLSRVSLICASLSASRSRPIASVSVSESFPAAIASGSTIVRVGRRLFARPDIAVH